MIPVIIGFAYIPPECSAIHQYLHKSLWLSRSKEIESFQQLGPTLVVGDWNVRIGDLKMTWTLKNSILPGNNKKLIKTNSKDEFLLALWISKGLRFCKSQIALEKINGTWTKRKKYKTAHGYV